MSQNYENEEFLTIKIFLKEKNARMLVKQNNFKSFFIYFFKLLQYNRVFIYSSEFQKKITFFTFW